MQQHNRARSDKSAAGSEQRRPHWQGATWRRTRGRAVERSSGRAVERRIRATAQQLQMLSLLSLATASVQLLSSLQSSSNPAQFLPESSLNPA